MIIITPNDDAQPTVEAFCPDCNRPVDAINVTAFGGEPRWIEGGCEHCRLYSELGDALL